MRSKLARTEMFALPLALRLKILSSILNRRKGNKIQSAEIYDFFRFKYFLVIKSAINFIVMSEVAFFKLS